MKILSAFNTFINKFTKDTEISAQEIASKIKTHKSLEALEERLDKLKDKSLQYEIDDKDRLYAKNEQKVIILKKAIEIAGNTPYRYFFDYKAEIEIPLEVLLQAGKTISKEEYRGLKEDNKKYFKPIILNDHSDADDVKKAAKDALSEEIKELLEFKKIIDSELEESKKVKKINILLNRSDFLDEVLNIDIYNNSLSPYEQYLDYLKKR